MFSSSARSLADRLRSWSALTWCISGFLLSYLLFFVLPVFLLGETMHLPASVPALAPIGSDLKEIMAFVQASLVPGGTPYIRTAKYPPLTYLLLRPLLVLQPHARYVLFSLISLICYVVATWFFPLKSGRATRATPQLMLVFATGLISYGFQFELERGQFNVIVACLVYAAIWIFHSGKGKEIWAYVLFSLSVQLKLYPLVFIVLFVHDWGDWKRNLARFSYLGLANFGLFFVLGPRVLLGFCRCFERSQCANAGHARGQSFRSCIRQPGCEDSVRRWCVVAGSLRHDLGGGIG